VRWLADECVDAPLARQLRETGHDVAYTMEGDGGATDAEIIGRAHIANERKCLREWRERADPRNKSIRRYPRYQFGSPRLRLRRVRSPSLIREAPW
jgi:hypothetical protein